MNNGKVTVKGDLYSTSKICVFKVRWRRFILLSLYAELTFTRCFKAVCRLIGFWSDIKKKCSVVISAPFLLGNVT